MSNPIDYSEHQPEAPTDNVLGQISSFVEEYAKLKDALSMAQKQVDDLQLRMNSITQKEIPDIMDANRLSDISTASGVKVKIEEKIRASLSKARQPEGFKWLNKNGHGDLIKTEVVAKFGRGDMKFALDLLKNLEGDEYVPMVELTEKVHANSLGALVRELLAAGKECPQELFGVFKQRNAKIVMPKEKVF